MTRRTVAGIAVTAIALILLLLYGIPPDPRKAIPQLLDKGRAAIEAGDIKAVMSCISLSYRDDLGFTYGNLNGSFRYTFSEFTGIRVSSTIIDLKAGKDTGIAEITVRVKGTWRTANQETDIAGSENGPERVFVVCKKEGRKFRVISTRWPGRKDGMLMLGGTF